MNDLLAQTNMRELVVAVSITQADLGFELGSWGAIEYLLERLNPERCNHLKVVSLSHLRKPTGLSFLPGALANANLERLQLHVESGIEQTSWPNIKHLTVVQPLGAGLSQLQELVLWGFDLDKAERNVPQLFNLTTLRVLMLIDCTNMDQLLLWLSERPIHSRAIREIAIENLDNVERSIDPGSVSAWIASCKKLAVLQLDISCFQGEAIDDLIEAILESKETLEALRLGLSRDPWAHPDPGGNSNTNNLDLLSFPPYALNGLYAFPKLQELSLCLDMSARDLGGLYRILPPNLLVLDITIRNREAAGFPELASAVTDLVENTGFLKVVVVRQTALWRSSSGMVWARCFLVDETNRITVVNGSIDDAFVPGVGKLGELRMNIHACLEFPVRTTLERYTKGVGAGC